MRAQFDLLDVFRLQVQEDWPDLENLVLNPSGVGGAWGWSTPDGFAATVSGGTALTFSSVDFLGGQAASDPVAVPLVAVTGDYQVRGSINVDDVDDLGDEPYFRILFRLADGGELAYSDHVFLTGPGSYEIDPYDVPAGTAFVQIYVSVDSPLPAVVFRDVVLNFGTPEAIAASDPLTEPPWIDITGPTSDVTIERDELNVGVLTAVVHDSTLDPASSELIRPGKRCRAQALVAGEWEDIFPSTSLLDDPSAAYVVNDPHLPENKRVQIRIQASDAAADLTNDPRPIGVGTLAELPAVLIGTGVPWNINGSSDAIDPDEVVTVSVNENASALDQVAITRDSVLGYAWIDRKGTLQVWDRAEISATVDHEFDESDYTPDGISVDFDVQRCFNTVDVVVVRINPGTGETEEVRYGPYVDAASVRQWRTRRAEFKVQGIDEDLVDDYAADILATNSTPTKRINSLTFPIRTLEELEAKALVDLYQLASTSNTFAGITDQQARITSVRHRIKGTKDRGRWHVEVDFSTDGSVAPPQVTPSPTAGGATKTLSQLLRPVGEVTMWFGAKADIPAGWLALDGTTFDADQYPELEELLGSTTLPNFEDRFPIGAGSKALGTSGGSPTVNLPAITNPSSAGARWFLTSGGADEVPRYGSYTSHTHGYTGGATVDVLNPWRALWFIIRAA